MLDFSKKFFTKMTAAFAAVVLLAGCFQDSGVSSDPSKPPVKGESATMQVRMRIGAVNALSKGSTITLSKMIVVMTSAATPADTIRDTILSGAPPLLNSLSTTQQNVSKTYLVKGLRVWKIVVSVRDTRGFVTHIDSATTPPLGVADTAFINLGLPSKYAMYEAKFLSLPDSITSATGNIKQRLNINRLVLKVDGVVLRDSMATPGPYFAALSAQPHVLSHDYVSAANKTAYNSGTVQNLNGVHFLSDAPLIGFIVGAGGIVRRTSDGGQSWTTNTVPSGSKALRGVYFTSGLVGFIVGDSITLRTSTLGSTWTAQTTPAALNSSLKSVYFVNASTGFAVSSSVYRTTNGGVDWGIVFGVPPAFSIRFADANTGWVVGTTASTGLPSVNTNIRKTTDGGSLWTEQVTPVPSQTLRSVFPVNTNLVYAVGDAGKILRTTNGGINWVAMANSNGQGLKSVYFLDAAVGYAVGDNGTILSTSDSGWSWAVQTSPVTANLTSINFSGSKGYIVGENGTFIALTGPHLVEMLAYGPMGTWNVANPLFSGSKYVDVGVGVDATIPLVLKWVGPSSGGGSITATLSRVGRVSIIGKLPGTP